MGHVRLHVLITLVLLCARTPDRELVKIGMQSCVAGTFAPVPPTSLQRARSQSITQSSIMAPSSALVDKAPGPRDPSTSETRPSQSTVSALARQPILEEDPGVYVMGGSHIS